MQHVILGCGDIGRRIVKLLLAQQISTKNIVAYVNSEKSQQAAIDMGLEAQIIDLDDLRNDLEACERGELYYTVAPQKSGHTDERSRTVLAQFNTAKTRPKKIVLLSTTGVYGDRSGEWVDETSPVRPETERGKRRLDAEQQWLTWGNINSVDVVVLRVPGIYAFSRIPRARLEQGIPVVNAHECGYTNRIHAEDLARVAVTAMHRAAGGEIFNVTDGTPGKITEYLLEAAKQIGLPPLPQISMQQAQDKLSTGMLSYLSESRKISNKKMLSELEIKLAYPDFKRGLQA